MNIKTPVWDLLKMNVDKPQSFCEKKRSQETEALLRLVHGTVKSQDTMEWPMLVGASFHSIMAETTQPKAPRNGPLGVKKEAVLEKSSVSPDLNPAEHERM